jgi:hypothetical protein
MIKQLVNTIMSHDLNIINEVIKRLCQARGIEITTK